MTETTHAATGVRDVVIVGGGPAAHRLADSLHARDTDRTLRVTVVGEEIHRPYDRVALSTRLADAATDLTLQPTSMWDDGHIRLVTGERVIAVDGAARTATTSGGLVLAWDELVLATGSSAPVPALPGSDHARVYRTIDDVDALVAETRDLAAAHGRPARVLVAGGGLLGLEAAGGLAKLGADAAVVHSGGWLMSAQLDEGAGRALGRIIAGQGIGLHLGTRPAAVLVGGRGGGGRRARRTALASTPTCSCSRSASAPATSSRGTPGSRSASAAASRRRPPARHPPTRCLGDRRGRQHRGSLHRARRPRLRDGRGRRRPPARRRGRRSPASTTCPPSSSSRVSTSRASATRSPHGARRLEVVYADPVGGVYKKLVMSDDATTLLGGILVGDAVAVRHAAPDGRRGSSAATRPPTSPARAAGGARGRRAARRRAPSARATTSPPARSAASVTSTPRAAPTSPASRRAPGPARAAARACRSSRSSSSTELEKSGVDASATRCASTSSSRAPSSSTSSGCRGSRPSARSSPGYGTGRGCDICKPVIGSILASLGTGHVLDGERGDAAGHQRPRHGQPPEGRLLLGRPAHPRRRDHARGAHRDRPGGDRTSGSTRRSPAASASTCSAPGSSSSPRSGSGSSTPASSRATPTASRCAP